MGYNPKVVTTVYLGYASQKSLSSMVFSGTFLTLPIWTDIMGNKIPFHTRLTIRFPQ